MAYTYSEQDSGKKSLEEDNDISLNIVGTHRGTTQRGEDAHTEGKRRKFNDGGYDSSQYWNDSAQDHHYGEHLARGFANNMDFHHSKKRLVPSEPSSHVIFLGLDQDFTEADLQAYLFEHGFSIETVTIIRERSTGKSKGFGFAQFSTVEQARAFVDPLFPFIQVPPPASHGASATAAFYKALKLGSPHGGRRVKIDYSQSANPGDRNRFGRFVQINDGTRDIGNAQAAVLLFRGLDPLSGVQAIAQAMRACQGPQEDGAKGMKRIILIKDKVTMASWGFAFVEFIDIQAASVVLGATMSPQLHPNGFRISDRPVAASFAHPYSFQPLADTTLRDEASLPSSAALGGTNGTWVRYWDEASTAAVLDFHVEEGTQEMPMPMTAKEKKEKKKRKVADLAGGASSSAPIEASPLPVSDKPVTLSFKGSIGSRPASNPMGTTTKAAFSLGFADDLISDEHNTVKENQGSASGDTAKVAGRVGPMIASKKIVKNISKWNQVQEELKPAMVPPLLPTIPQMELSSSLSVKMDEQFLDMPRLACLLCSRQFKSMDQLRRHNQESELHKKNMQDPKLRDLACGKVNAAKVAHDVQQEPPRYRDRASERRIMHNQPDIPSTENVDDKHKSRKYAESLAPPPSSPPLLPSPPSSSVHPGHDESNIGNKLLKMMGWKAGAGLGLKGEGRVDPIETAIYSSGVGLGASKGKEIGKYPEGYAGYVTMVQDAARHRYHSD